MATISAYVNNNAFLSTRKEIAFFFLIKTDDVGNKKIISCFNANGDDVPIKNAEVRNNDPLNQGFIQWNLGLDTFFKLFNN